MESRKYTFNKSTLTVKFGSIIESQAEIIVSSDDSDISMGGGEDCLNEIIDTLIEAV